MERSYKEVFEKFGAWVEWELNVQGDFLSPQDARFLDAEFYVECGVQGTGCPSRTKWNDDYFWENIEGVSRFLKYLGVV